MLQLQVPITSEYYDEKNEVFIEPKYITLQLEHSLVSLSKWESKWNRAFFSKREKTPEEIVDYIKCMTITQNVKPEVYDRMSRDNIIQIQKYIEAPMSATYFAEDKNGKINKETVTSELIYYWMIALNIPFECQKWHLNRLLTLIRVCNLKNQPPKKMSKRDIMKRNSALNAARRNQLNTRG